jgi:hypothetical protein
LNLHHVSIFVPVFRENGNSNSRGCTKGYDATSIEFEITTALGIVNINNLIIKHNSTDHGCQEGQRHELAEHTGVHGCGQLGNMAVTVMLHAAAAFVV